MNPTLQKLFRSFYTPRLTQTEYDSITDTENLRQRIIALFKKHHITSMFDAGCNDCIWMNQLLNNIEIQYQGGDISPDMIEYVHDTFPGCRVDVHDATTDAFPIAELLFVRDVAIHLNNADKRKLWNNWLDSSIPWILITHNLETDHNSDFEYTDEFPFSSANWQLAPWCFPKPVDQVWEYGVGGRCMALWNQNQFKGKI